MSELQSTNRSGPVTTHLPDYAYFPDYTEEQFYSVEKIHEKIQDIKDEREIKFIGRDMSYKEGPCL
jgi:hypothetical protein